MSVQTWSILSARLAAIGASTLELEAIEAAYYAMSTAEQGALDTLVAGLASGDLMTMLSTWRTSGSPFQAGFPGGGLPFGTGVAVLTGNPADDVYAISAGTGTRLSGATGDLTSVRSWGAAGDGQVSTTGAMSTGQHDLTDSSNPYTIFDVGKTVYVAGAGTSSGVLQTTIATFVSSGHVTTTTAASTTVSGATVKWGTNDFAAFQRALNANVNGTITLPPPVKTFYLLDTGGPGGANPTGLSVSGGYQSVWGLGGPDDIVVLLGPEGATASGRFQMFQKTVGATVTFLNVTLQGPDQLGNGGAPVNPGSPGSSTYCAPIGETGTVTLGGAWRFINSRVRRFSFMGAVNSPSAVDAEFTTFEGYGNDWRSMGVAAGDDGSSGYLPSKYVRLNQCRVKAFGDPAGGNLYHHLYVGTSMDLFVSNTIFDTPASTATGNMLQHFDSNVALANAAQHAEYTNVYFSPGTQGGVITSYNCPTKFEGCTLVNLQNPGVSIAGPTIVNGTTFTILTASGSALATTTQGQSTGLDWGLQLGGGSRIRYLANVAATGINITNANATSEFTIGGETTFEGAPSGSGIYVSMSAAVTVNARINIGKVSFRDHPNFAIRTFGSGTVNVAGARMLLTGGTCIGTATNSLARLAVTDTEFAGSGTIFSLSAVPTVTDVARNYGSQWAATLGRNVQNTAYAVQPYDEFVVTSTTGGFTKTLPAVASVPVGKQITFLNATSAGSSDTVARNGTDTIGVTAATSVTVATGGGKTTLRAASSSSWDVVG